MSLGETIGDVADYIGEKITLGTVEIILGVIIAAVVAVVLFSLGLPQNSVDKFFDSVLNVAPIQYRGFFGLALFGLFIVAIGMFLDWTTKRIMKQS